MSASSLLTPYFYFLNTLSQFTLIKRSVIKTIFQRSIGFLRSILFNFINVVIELLLDLSERVPNVSTYFYHIIFQTKQKQPEKINWVNFVGHRIFKLNHRHVRQKYFGRVNLETGSFEKKSIILVHVVPHMTYWRI